MKGRYVANFPYKNITVEGKYKKLLIVKMHIGMGRDSLFPYLNSCM